MGVAFSRAGGGCPPSLPAAIGWQVSDRERNLTGGRGIVSWVGHPGDMETYGRPDALDEEIVRAGTCVDVLLLV
jgi:hypothetical protein